MASYVRGRADSFGMMKTFLLIKRGLQPVVQLKIQLLSSQLD